MENPLVLGQNLKLIMNAYCDYLFKGAIMALLIMLKPSADYITAYNYYGTN